MDSKAPQENSELPVETPKDEVSNKEDGNLVLNSFFALHRRISQLEIEKKVKLLDAPRWGETDPSIGSVRDIVLKQVIRRGPSDAPILPDRNLGEGRETYTT